MKKIIFLIIVVGFVKIKTEQLPRFQIDKGFYGTKDIWQRITGTGNYKKPMNLQIGMAINCKPKSTLPGIAIGQIQNPFSAKELCTVYLVEINKRW